MKKTKFIGFLSLFLAASLVFTGCASKNATTSKIDAQNQGIKQQEKQTLKGETETEPYNIKIGEESVEFTDGRGEKVSIKKNPQRVVCLFNSYLDIWDKCGGKVIGRVEESKDKPIENAKNAAFVGTSGSPSVEKILSLKPDLVILTSDFKAQLKLAKVLEQNKVPMIILKNNFKKDYFQTVRLFTALTGKEDLYKKYAENVKKSINDIIEKVPDNKKTKVLVLFASSKKVNVRGSNSMVGEMLNDLNTENISDTANESIESKDFSMEKIIEEDPDFIFVQTMGSNKKKIFDRLKKDVESNPAWSSLKAVKNKKYIYLPKDLYLYKPNDRYAEAYEGLAKILYPDVFK